jgi:hypothetical protein
MKSVENRRREREEGFFYSSVTHQAARYENARTGLPDMPEGPFDSRPLVEVGLWPVRLLA